MKRKTNHSAFISFANEVDSGSEDEDDQYHDFPDHDDEERPQVTSGQRHYWKYRLLQQRHEQELDRARNHNSNASPPQSVQHDLEDLTNETYTDPTQLYPNPAPARLNHYVHVFIIAGKTKQFREFRQLLSCSSDADSIEAALTLLLVKEQIDAPLDAFKFGVKQTKSEVAITIYRFNLNAANLRQIDWSKVYEFTLTQHKMDQPASSTPNSFTLQANTEYLSQQTDREAEAEQTLQNMFGSNLTAYSRLRGQTKIYLKAKKDLMHGVNEDDVKSYIDNALWTEPQSHRPQNMLFAQQQQTQSTLQNLLSLVLVQSLTNMCSQPYGAVHAQSHNVSERRWSPISSVQHEQHSALPSSLQSALQNILNATNSNLNDNTHSRRGRTRSDKEQMDDDEEDM